jgi:hypothetical protein
VISITKDGGKTWKNISPKKMPKGGRVESIEPSIYNPAKAYIAVDRHLLGDETPYIYKTENYGESWELMTTGSNGIPSNHTARVVREDPIRDGLLYAGTEYGMFISFNDGETWKKFQQNLPVTPITDITLFRGDLILSTMGRGFWILDQVTALRDENITRLDDTPVLFKPHDTYRYQTPWGGEFPEYPSTSVTIDYYLPSDIKDGVSLQILDAQGNEVATIVSDSNKLKSTTEKVENMNLSMTFVYMDEKLETKKGLNRFEWNLEQKGPWAKNEKRRFKNGPMVLPGKYTARLTVGEQSFEKQFEVLMDPKLEGDGVSLANMKEQQELQFKVIELLSEARMLQDKVENKIEELKMAKASEDELKKYKQVLSELKNAEGAYPEVVLVSQITYLYYILSGADKQPGQEEKDSYQELLAQFNALKQKAGL